MNVKSQDFPLKKQVVENIVSLMWLVYLESFKHFGVCNVDPRCKKDMKVTFT